MLYTVAQIAQKLQGSMIGDGDVEVSNLNGLEDAQAGDLSFLGSANYIPYMEKTQASAVLVPKDYSASHDFPLIKVENPYLAFSIMLSELEKEVLIHPTGIHPSATQADGVTLGENCALDAHVHIAENATLGDNVVLYAGVYVGRHSVIGSNTVIFPNTTVREHVVIGERCIIHSNVAIGTDGFGFATIDKNKVKIPQVGKVIIGNDVEIGSNSSIDRAMCGITRIGNGTKLDNLVQIAHNVTLGKNNAISSMSGVAGSTTLGDNVTMAGRSGIIDHAKIGNDVIVGANAGVLKSVEDGKVVSGYPAIDHKANLRMMMSQRRLPKALSTIRDLEKRIEELEKKLNG